MADAITDFVVTPHAAFEMDRRGIGEMALERVLAAPEQRETVQGGRNVLQSRLEFDGRTYLVRVFMDVDRKPAEVVTVYRTSRMARYWRSET